MQSLFSWLFAKLLRRCCSVVEHREAGEPEQELFADDDSAKELWDVCDLEVYYPIQVGRTAYLHAHA
jgi:hypothetical protein